MEKVLLSGSYSPMDVIFLLKEISGLIKEQNNEFRENAIQSGIHYSEMLPIEYHPTDEYMKIFYETLEESKTKLATLVSVLSHKILATRGDNLILVSLARAGTPIGILIKRYIKYKFNISLPHYSISIIRDKGIDENAMLTILRDHPNCNIQFIDGWTGKGVIQDTLIDACNNLNKKLKISLNPSLAVLSDPAYCTDLYGTREDFLIPSACLNSTVSGLMSRTVHNASIIGEKDYHGAKYYKEWEAIDVSNYFIDTVTNEFQKLSTDFESLSPLSTETTRITHPYKGLEDISTIKSKYQITNINLIKPGVGETTRVLLRRIPWRILINSANNPNLKHIEKLAEERKVPIEIYKDMSYSCCGIIKPLELGDI
jgi:hypothetical protein